MFSAGNEDMNKAMQVLALQGGSLENKVDFISVGSPVGKSDLERSAGAVDAKIIGQYNTWKDPVTHSKTVGTAVVGLFALGTVLGATEGLGIMSSVLPAATTGLGHLTNTVLGAWLGAGLGVGLGAGPTAIMIKKNHSFEKYINRNIDGVREKIVRISPEYTPVGSTPH